MAITILLVATAVGALMPSKPLAPTPPPAADGNIVETRIVDEPVAEPTTAQEPALYGSEVSLPRQPDGHFWADVEVNGRMIRFLVDTGASGVAINQHDAGTAGLTFSPSDFTVVGQGASGEVLGQPVMLDRIKLGARSVEQLPAIVLADSEHSLLGQNFLRQFDSVTIKNDKMVLR
jgi:aspartyl protease family protein